MSRVGLTLLTVAAALLLPAAALGQSADPLEAARADATRGNALMQDGQWAEAADALESAARVMVAEQGAQTAESLSVLLLYTRALEEAERFADALLMASQIRQHALAAGNVTAAIAIVEQQARLQWVLGDPASALETYAILLPFAESRPDEYAGQLPAYRLMEAAILVDLYRFDEAEARLERLIEDPATPAATVHAARAVLAKSLADRGEYDQAATMFLATLASYEADPAPSGPVIVESLSNLAATLMQAGRFEDAEAIADRALAALAENDGVTNRATGDVLLIRAAAQLAHGDDAAAQASLQNAIANLDQALGAEHPQVLQARSDLAALHARRGETDAARALAQSILPVAQHNLGAESVQLARIHDSIGAVARETGDGRTAAMLLAAAQQALADGVGEDHPDTLTTRLRLADLLISPDRHAPSDALAVIRGVTSHAGTETRDQRRMRERAGLPSPGWVHAEAAWGVAHEVR